jgi:hypothetical protein
MITALDETRRAPEPGGLALDHRLARQYLGAGKARGERLDHYGLQQAGGLAVLTGLAGGFVCHPIRQVSVIAAGSVGHRVALMITALHRTGLCRHAQSHTAEGRQHEANNQQQNQANSTHGKLLLRLMAG